MPKTPLPISYRAAAAAAHRRKLILEARKKQLKESKPQSVRLPFPGAIARRLRYLEKTSPTLQRSTFEGQEIKPGSTPDIDKDIEKRIVEEPWDRPETRNPPETELEAGKTHSVAKKTPPSFSMPHSATVKFVFEKREFVVYTAWVEYYLPGLIPSPGIQVIRLAKDCKLPYFGTLVNWLYTQTLFDEDGQPICQTNAIAHWWYGKRWKIPRLQNQALLALDEKLMKVSLRIAIVKFVWSVAGEDDPMLAYLVEHCAAHSDPITRAEVELTLPVAVKKKIALARTSVVEKRDCREFFVKE